MGVSVVVGFGWLWGRWVFAKILFFGFARLDHVKILYLKLPFSKHLKLKCKS